MPERSKGEVLRNYENFCIKLLVGSNPTGSIWFRSVEVSTEGFDPSVPGSNPGGTYFFIIPPFNV